MDTFMQGTLTLYCDTKLPKSLWYLRSRRPQVKQLTRPGMEIVGKLLDIHSLLIELRNPKNSLQLTKYSTWYILVHNVSGDLLYSRKIELSVLNAGLNKGQKWYGSNRSRRY